MFLTEILMAMCFVTVMFAHNGHHYGHPFIDKRSASAVLSCKSNPRNECCTNIVYEKWCEEKTSRSFCMEVNESGREEQCHPNSCPSGQTCYLSVPCVAHYKISCDASNPCLAFPCQNDGTCNHTGTNMYDCKCKTGYDPRSDCAAEINECTSNPCQNGGSCHDHLNKYSCSCRPGFTGVHCETDIDECNSSPCQNGATCHDYVNRYTCTCMPGFNGVVCETDVNECNSNPCRNGGTCHDLVNRYRCTCRPGFNGVNCEQDINECNSTPCQNGATCHDHINRYSCTCIAGFIGYNCDTDFNECNSNPCRNGGTCHDLVNRYRCTCRPGFNGIHCEQDINECNSTPCQNEATCHDHINRYSCTCLAGFIGYNCDTDINECNSTPCQNGATCHDHINRYSCTCIAGFIGYNCDTDFSECNSNPCRNGGTCHDLVNRYRCTCRPGFNGIHCEQDINECNSTPCQNGATCHDHVNRYSCTCLAGFIGYNCDTDINECNSTPCQNGATCHDHINRYSCTCIAGFIGYNCDTDINECDSNPCLNGATCNNLINEYTCTCIPGYMDVNCQTEINECDSSPCQNGGTCHDHVNMYTCSCVPGFTGINCQTDINECASNPCINGGSCVDHVNYFTCECTERYNGTMCEKDCRPGPVDLLFVLDASSSSRTDCERMKDFMSTTVKQLAVGPDDFQIAAIAYSFRPILKWTFSKYSDNDTLLQAITSIHCSGGSTNTGRALELAIEVFSDPAYGGRSNSALKQIILVTDGMSTDRSNTIQQSWNVVAKGIKLYVVGLGHYVDHRELHAMVHDSRYVFSSTDNQLLWTMLRETAHPDCNDCRENSLTDILLLLDSSSNERIKYSTKAAIQLIRYLDLNNTDIQMGIMSYSETTKKILDIAKHTENELSSSVTKVRLRSAIEANISDAIKFGKTELNDIGKTSSKKVLILFTDGKGNNTIEWKSSIQDTVDEGIDVFIFGIGRNKGYEAIRNVVTDSFYSLLSADTTDHSPLQTVKSESWHTTCAENIFELRV